MRRARAESLQVKCLTQLDTSLYSFWLAYTYVYTPQNAPRNAFFWLPERYPRLQNKNWNVISRFKVKLIFESKTTNINSRLFVLAGKQRARSIQPKFPEISVQRSMDRFGPTGKVSKKLSPPFEVDHFSRSDRSEFWLNGSRPKPYGRHLDPFR